MPEIKPIHDPLAKDPRLLRNVAGYKVQLQKTGPRAYTASCASLPDWQYVVTGYTSPARMRFSVIDPQIEANLTSWLKARTPYTQDITQSSSETSVPQHLQHLAAELVEVEVFGIHYWFDFDVKVAYCEGVEDFCADLTHILSPVQLSRFEKYARTSNKDFFDKNVCDILAQSLTKHVTSKPDSMTPNTIDRSVSADPATAKTITINVPFVGDIALDLYAKGNGHVVKVKQWPGWDTTDHVRPGSGDVEWLVEATRDLMKLRLGEPRKGEPGTLKMITKASVNAEHIGALEAYILTYDDGVIATIRHDDKYFYGHSDTPEKAMDIAADEVSAAWLAENTVNADQNISTRPMAMEESSVSELVLDMQRDEAPTMSASGLPALRAVEEAEDEAEEDLGYEFVTAGDDPDFEREFAEYDQRRVISNDGELRTYLSILFLKGTGEVIEITGKSKFEFIAPVWDEAQKPVLDDLGKIKTEPARYDYNASINIENDEDKEALSYLNAKDLQFYHRCFEAWQRKAKIVCLNTVKTIIAKIEQLQENITVMNLRDRAQKGDKRAQDELKKMIRAKQEEQAKAQGITLPPEPGAGGIIAATEADARAAGVEIEPNRAERRNRRARRHKVH